MLDELEDNCQRLKSEIIMILVDLTSYDFKSDDAYTRRIIYRQAYAHGVQQFAYVQ